MTTKRRSLEDRRKRSLTVQPIPRLEWDDFSSNRHPTLASCFVARPDGKPVSTFPGRALVPRMNLQIVTRLRRTVFGLGFFALLAVTAAPVAAQAPAARNGMVVAQEARAARIGVEGLEKGGNAVDPPVATGFALALTYPRA